MAGKAALGRFLLPRIHPFRDGNGHCTRMLSLAILAPHYCPEQLLAFLAAMQARRMRTHEYFKDIELGKATISDFVEYMLGMLAEAGQGAHPA